jgi:glycosyltransferase involved in cell wall biosynthesis
MRTFHVLRLLSEVFDVTALCFERGGIAQHASLYDPEESARVLGKYAHTEVFRLPQNHSRVRFAWDHLRSLATGRAYTHYLYDSDAFADRIEALLREESFDLVHVDSLDLVRYLPACQPLPIVCVHHNVESQLLARRSEVEGPYWLRCYFALQARLTERDEKRWVPAVACNVAVSEADAETLRRFGSDARVEVVPNAVDTEEFEPGESKREGIVYLGGTNWFPNLDALEYFCESMLPTLRKHDPGFAAQWIGACSPEQQKHFREAHSVTLTGYVPDIRPLARDAFCNIVPLRAGGGTRLKILTSWALGKPVVSTSVGCEGLDARDGENILIRDDPAEFVEAILVLKDDPELQDRIGGAARDTVVSTYSWRSLGPSLHRLYRDLIR